MKRLEEEIEEELKESKEFGEMHEAAEEYLQWFRDGKEKYLMHGAGMLTKSFTGAPGLALLLGNMLGHPLIVDTFNGLFDIVEGAMDDISYAMEDLTSYGVDEALFGLLRRQGLSEALWLSMFSMRPVLFKLEPEIFVMAFPMLQGEGILIKMLPMVLSIANPALQIVLHPNVMKHLGELQSYEDSGLYRYQGVDERIEKLAEED
ncbi:MAG: hypothetical protein SVE93_01175 [Candidatus Thermoplasmatota archaeon]|nr:hypothetical protein [Candidatus Thermoplasmatota archaeon]